MWLDRLETGDYGDRVEVSRHLASLNHIEQQVFHISTLAGKPRPRSSRLRESIDRLTVGCATELLADLTSRVSDQAGARDPNILQEAMRAGDVFRHQFHWGLAAKFYELASRLATPQEAERFSRHLHDCRRRLIGGVVEEPRFDDKREIESEPAVNNLRLPEVWAQLSCRFHSSEYLRFTAEAAERINDEAMVAWAKHQAAKAESERTFARERVDENVQRDEDAQ